MRWEKGFNAAAQTEAAQGGHEAESSPPAAASRQSPLGSSGAGPAQGSRRCGRGSATRRILKLLKLGVSKLSSASARKWQHQGSLKLTPRSNSSSSDGSRYQARVCFIRIKGCNSVVKGFLAVVGAQENMFSSFDSLQSLV